MKEEWMTSLSFRVDSIFFSQISAQFASGLRAKESSRRKRERECAMLETRILELVV